MDFPGGSVVRESTCSAGDVGSIPGSGRSAGEGMAIHSSILAGEVLETGQPGGYSSQCRRRIRQDLPTKQQQKISNVSVMHWCVTNCFKLIDLNTNNSSSLTFFLGASVGFTWNSNVAAFINGLDGLRWPQMFWGSPGMAEWLRYLRFSLHLPFTLDSSECDLRIPREPVPRTSTHQASSCVKCDAALVQASHMAKQWLTVEGDYARAWG